MGRRLLGKSVGKLYIEYQRVTVYGMSKECTTLRFHHQELCVCVKIVFKSVVHNFYGRPRNTR